MNVFDIIGPIMVGPSSSHTAGAARIAAVTRKLLGEDVKHAVIKLHGSFANTYKGHGTDRAIIGSLLGYKVDNPAIRESFKHASEAGLNYSFETADLGDVHPNTALIEAMGVSGKKIEVPCIKRNATGSANALAAAEMALAGIESIIPADEDIDAMGSIIEVIEMKIDSARLIFFSPTGSTEKVINSIAKGLDVNEVKITNLTTPQIRKSFSNNHDIANKKDFGKESGKESSEVFNKNIREKFRIIVEEDIAIICVPVYGQKIPYFLNECLQNIEGNGKPAILVCVYGNINSGIALKQLYKLAQKCHFTVAGAAEFIGRHSFCNEQIHVAENRPDTKDLTIAENFGKAVKRKLLKKANLLKVSSLLKKKLSISAFIITKFLPKNSERLVTKQPTADIDLCKKCGYCIKACPMGAINAHNLTIREDLCIRCFACARKCPNQARKISFKNRLVIMPYLKLNGSKRKEPKIYLFDA
jgi:ferredoxin/flavodoxin